MAQYWLQTPIENAKEVVQRFINDNVATLPGLAGMSVSYTSQTEVIFYAGLFPTFSANEIYFGTFYVTFATEINMLSTIKDGLGNVIITFDSAGNVESGQYPSIIWNSIDGEPTAPGYFVGYKFNLS